jgi:hypothetical protein
MKLLSQAFSSPDNKEEERQTVSLNALNVRASVLLCCAGLGKQKDTLILNFRPLTIRQVRNLRGYPNEISDFGCFNHSIYAASFRV